MSHPTKPRDAVTTAKQPAAPAASLLTRRVISRFIIIFLTVSALGMGWEYYLMTNNRAIGLRTFVATGGAWIPKAFGLQCNVVGTRIMTSQQGMEVTPECSGIEPTAIFLAGVLAFPSSRRGTVIGVLLGLLGVGVLNILRVSGLVAVAELKPLWFEPVHTALTHLFPLIAVLPLWLAWLAMVMKERPVAIQGRAPNRIAPSEPRP